MFGGDATANEASYVANFTYHRCYFALTFRRITHLFPWQSVFWSVCVALEGRLLSDLDFAVHAAAGLGFMGNSQLETHACTS